jgi:hypothetical protein
MFMTQMKWIFAAAVSAGLLQCMAGEWLDLSGEWDVRGEGWECRQTASGLGSEWMIPPGTPSDYTVKGKARLPGTLADSGLGVEQTYGTWSSMCGVQSRQALCLRRKFIGKAVYSRRVTVPESMRGKALELVMERVMWKSSLKVDGNLRGEADSLGTPHVYGFAPGELEPGEHLFEIEVDNTCRYDFSGWSHGWGPTTQTQWNGIIGEFAVREANPLRAVRIFAGWPANGRVVLKLPHGTPLDAVEIDGLAVTGTGRSGDEATVSFEGEPEYWSEFHPRLYTLRMRGGGFSFSRRFAFRTVSAKGHRLFMNGKPFWFRGNVDNCQFPLTGYPAMTKAEWRRQIRIQQQNGCNGMRTHTWTPPEAAFAVADELGFYILAETCYWSDGDIMKRAVGRGNDALDRFCHAELKRVQDAYGDHPSMISMGLGNELGACDFDVLEQWMSEAKAYDGRCLSIASTARKVCPSDDYMTTHSYPGIGATRSRRANHTDWDYEDVYSRTPIPVLAHEIGQWPVYPHWNDIGRFDGLLKAYDWMEMRDTAVSNGTLRFQRLWHAASIKTSRLMYKDEVESFMRTASCAGLQLLDVRDYTGQGEALVGWLDAFFDAKPGCAELPAFSDVFRPVPFLARFRKYVWSAGETFSARLQIRNMTENTIPAGTTYPVSFAGKCGQVKLEKAVLPGEIGDVAEVSYPLEGWMAGVRNELAFGENRWSVFVTDAGETPVRVPDGVTLTDDPAKMAKVLAAGGRVVYTGTSAVAGMGKFVPVYWSTLFLRKKLRHSMIGTWFNEDHPAFAHFFTEDWMDWQWRDMTDQAVVHVLTGRVPDGFTPVAMPVPDIHTSELLGTMFEFRVGPGRAFVCGYPIGEALLPEARQLRKSVLCYVSSDAFRPAWDMKPDEFADLFAKPGKAEAAERERYLTPFDAGLK